MAVIYLIILFLVICCCLTFIGLNYIALIYILAYVSAVQILFIFTLMLIDVRKSELSYKVDNSYGLVIVIFLMFIFINLFDKIKANDHAKDLTLVIGND